MNSNSVSILTPKNDKNIYMNIEIDNENTPQGTSDQSSNVMSKAEVEDTALSQVEIENINAITPQKIVLSATISLN